MLTAAMILITLGFGAGALLLPGELDRRHLVGLDQRIVRLAPDVRAVEQTLTDLERKRRLLTTVQGLERSSLRPLPVLRELTDLLPVDAWLTSLTLDAKGIELTGQAATASALIPLLENSPRFQGVEFASPVTRGRDKEQFRIRAAWESAPGEAEAPRAPARKPPAPRSPLGVRS
jgi:general secretion pathway protein L